MPGNLLSADINMPNLEGKEDVNEKLQAVSGYLYMLLEQLRYTLSNLGQDNFNPSELDQVGKVITGPLTVRVEEAEKGLAKITVTVDGVQSTVRSIDGRFSVVEQNVEGLGIRTLGGTSYITGEHVKTGKIVSQNGASEINLNTGEARLSGSYTVTNPGTQEKVGGICWDSGGTDSSSDSKNRMYLYTNGSFAMKLKSDHRISLEASDLVYVTAGNKVEFSTGGVRWKFNSSGIYCNDVRVVSTTP